jgi:hypothetical protein
MPVITLIIVRTAGEKNGSSSQFCDELAAPRSGPEAA